MGTEIRKEIGRRLSEERERLGYTQPDFAALGGAKQRTLQDWERGVAAPNSEFLAVVNAHGLDLLYVLTGARALQSANALTAEEVALVDNYKHADEEGRAAARRVLSSLAQQKAA
jgi:transcriptional regulator with XRE-family HTH domain